MTDRDSQRVGGQADAWLNLCRNVVAGQKRLLAETSGIEARTVYAGRGEGGDRSLVIDRAAEDLVFAELDRLRSEGLRFTAISEERGEIELGGDETYVVIDPIDGSLNARRTLPSVALSIAVASGPTLADVELGYVYDFGAEEEFFARRGAGATLNGEPLQARGPGYGLELVGLEATKPELILPLVEGLAGKAFRIRSIGSLALTLVYVAGGRLDGMISARPARSVDVAAAQLIAREAGAVVEFDRLDLGEAHLGLAARYGVAAGLDEELLGTLLAIQRAGISEPA